MFKTEISDSLVIHKGEARVTLDDMFSTTRTWFQHPDFDPDRPVLWDLRKANIEADEADVSAWANSLREAVNPVRAGRKTALVLPTSEIAQFAVDLLSTYDFQSRVRVYQNDYEAAYAWLTTTIR